MIRDTLLRLTRVDPAVREQAPEVAIAADKVLVAAGVVLAAICWSLLSAYWDLTGHMKANWFGRSGAVLVASSIFLNARAAGLIPDFVATFEASAAGQTAPASSSVIWLSSVASGVSWLVGLFGTLIWAYGDWLIASCSKI